MSSRSLERIRKRKNEDEELIFIIFPALYLYLSQRKRQIRHNCFLYGKEHVRELLGGHLKNCLTAFRMEPHIFMWLASYLRTEGLILDSRIKVEEKLAFFLYMLSHNASYEDLQVEFHHSGQSFSKYINQFFDIIPTLSTRILKPLNLDEAHPKITTDSRFFPYFQNCIGAIDGSHVPVTRTPSRAAPWRNRKGTLSQNVMVACDFDLNITFISCGWEGSATDARVLSSAILRGFKVPNGKFYLVDGGYANTQFFLAPYRGVRYHLKEFGHGRRRPQNYKELFNHRHAVLRNHVERVLGVLKKRFPILKVGTDHKMKNQVKIPAAAAIFHNIIKQQNGDEEWLDNQEDNIDPADFIDVPDDDEKNQHVNFDKSQVQDKEKELKRDYRMLKDARAQSGVGWSESDFKLQAEPHLWDNLAISFGKRIKRFQTKAFPLYDLLGELYHKHTAEGSYNFTANAEQFLKPNVADVESGDDDEEELKQKGDEDDDLQILDQAEVAQMQTNPTTTRNGGPPTRRNNADPSASRHRKPKKSPKKSGGDGLIGVMERFVAIKEKEVEQESTQDFSIGKCIAALRTLEGFEAADKPKAFTVFKIPANREVFLSSIVDNDGSALAWLQMEIRNLK